MKAIVLLIFLASSVLISVDTIAKTTPSPYLYEQLKRKVYLKTFTKLLKNEKNLGWFNYYVNDRNGVDTQRTYYLIGEQAYEKYFVCQAHMCVGNNFIALFTLDGTKAWALLTNDDGTSRYLGNPDDNMKQALRTIENRGF